KEPSKALDFEDLCNKFDATGTQDSLTDLQKRVARTKFLEAIEGKNARFAAKIDDVRLLYNNNLVVELISSSGSRQTLSVTVTKDDEIKKFEKAGKGTSIVVEGPLTGKQGQVQFQ